MSIKNRRIEILLSLIAMAVAAAVWFYKRPGLSEFEKQVQRERHREREDGSDYYRSFVQYPLNAGLPRILEDVDQRATPGNRVYVLFHRSPFGKDILDPIKAVRALMNSNGEEVDMGHSQLAWSCTVNGKSYKSATGFTGESNAEGLRMAILGYGATPLLVDYSDGRMEPPWVVQVRSDQSRADERLTGVMIPVSEGECQSVLNKVYRIHKGDFSKEFRLPDVVTFPGGSKDRLVQPARVGQNCLGFVEWALEDVKAFPHKLFEGARHSFEIPLSQLGWPRELDNGHSIANDVREGLSRFGRLGTNVGTPNFSLFYRRGSGASTPVVRLEFKDPGKAQAVAETWPVLFGDTPWMRQLPDLPN